MCEKLTIQHFRKHFRLMFLLNYKSNFQVTEELMEKELVIKCKKQIKKLQTDICNRV